MGVDTVTWQALGLVLTLLGLGVSTLVWVRRGPARGLRAVAWSLLPLAAALTGTLRLAGDVVSAVGRWASRMVLDPLTWTGFAVAGAAAALFLVSGALLRREPGKRARGGSDELSQPGKPTVGRGAAPPPAATDPDLAEIEQILKRRGIT